MLVINGPALVATTTEAKKDLPGMFREACHRPVYVTSDGQHVGGIVSPQDMALLEAARSNETLVAEAAERYERLTSGATRRLTPAEFHAEAEALFADTPAARTRKRTAKA